jgi:tRNA threonylcarbamoyladenosine biosynthesis protein TsaE
MISTMLERTGVALREISTNSPQETFRFGFEFGESLPTPTNILLYGDLGVGKTVLAKGIVCGLGVEDPDDIVSPSFTLIQEYRVQGRIIQHVDLYRIDNPREIESLGLEELLLDEGMYVIVEWAEKLPYSDIANAVHIHLRDLGEDRRGIRAEYP